jgi:hypothetical protein
MLHLLTAFAMAQGGNLQIDPLMLTEASEVWSLIGRKNNPVWPGWDARATPILIYFPGKQDVLINHPKPPAGFKPYAGPLKSPIGPIFVRDGETVMTMDGQNTSTDVNGTHTLVLADTLSTRRQWVEGLAPQISADPDHAEKTITDSLFPNPYPSLAMFAHEAFHVYQNKLAPKKGGNELDLISYPTLSVDNNVGCALEADLLTDALHAKTSEEVKQAAVKWLAVRQWRRAAMPKASAAYEDGTEFSEGTAKYVEYRLMECLQGHKPSPIMWQIQGFHGYEDLSAERELLLKQLQDTMSGKMVVNNDPYGASPVRFRMYYSGMAIGALLDRLGADWHDRILKTDASLTSLAAEAIKATPQELADALASLKSSDRYAALVKEKQKLADDGQIHVQKSVQEFADAPGELVIDYNHVAKPRIGFAFTPFGILRVDDNRTLFRLIPIRGIVNSLSFSEAAPRAIMDDRKAKQVILQLTGMPNEDAIAAQIKDPNWKKGPISVAKLELPGVSLENVKGVLRVEGRKVTLEVAD